MDSNDPTPEDDNGAAASIMLAMGFSSFGEQQPKKRKLNHVYRAGTPAVAHHDGHGSPGQVVSPAAAAATPSELGDDGGGSNAPRPLHVPHGLPARPPAPAPGRGDYHGQDDGGGGRRGGYQGRGRGQGGGGALHGQDHGGRKPWYEEYYDVGSNYNPWEHLERAMGIKPQGTWLERGEEKLGRAHADGETGEGENEQGAGETASDEEAEEV